MRLLARRQRSQIAAMQAQVHAFRFLFVMLLLSAAGLQAQTINSARVGIAGLETATGGVWPSGDITFTINGTYTETIHYAQASTPESLAADFAALFTRDYAHVGFYSMAGADNVNLDVITFNFPSGQSCSTFSATATGTVPFTFNPSCSGSGSGGGTTPDTGTVTLTVNGSPFSSTTYGATSTPASIAAALTGSNSIATVTANSGLLYIQANGTGLATDYPYNLTITSDTTNFPTSFYPVNKSGNLTGGADGGSTAAPTTIYCYSITLTSDGNCDPSAPSGYDAVGNIVNSTDSVMGKWAYTYDVLDRLATAAAATGPYVVTKNEPFICWSYDSFGNRTHQMLSSSAPSGGGTTPCTAASGATTVADTSAAYAASNQMTSVTLPGQSTSTAISYDEGDALNRGNITADGRNTYLYDAEGRVCAVHGALGWTGYQYDATGTRVGKGTISSASCDLMANGYQPISDFVLDEGQAQMTEVSLSGVASGTWQHTNVRANGLLISTYDIAGLHFYLNDALGSRRFQTDALGVLEQDCQSLPFGDQLNCGLSLSAPTEHHFTGKERDAESGLDYFDARYYASGMGRWMSPDWSEKEDPIPYAKTNNPQSLNLYGYVSNNPLKNIDPNGHACNALNAGSGFCQRAVEYGKMDAEFRDKTRFFAAASAVSQLLASSALPFANHYISNDTYFFLEETGRDLLQFNRKIAASIRDGSLHGPDLDSQLVRKEQGEVTRILKQLQIMDPKAYATVIKELDSSTHPKGLEKKAGNFFATDKAFNNLLQGLQSAQDLTFAKEGDRVKQGDATVQHIEKTGGKDITGDKVP